MRICVLMESYPTVRNPYAQMWAHTRNAAYVAMGHTVDVFVFSGQQPYRFQGVSVYPVKHIANRNRLEQYDVIVVHQPNLRDHLRFLIARRRKTPVVYFFHGHEALISDLDYPPPYPYMPAKRLPTLVRRLYDRLKVRILRRWFESNYAVKSGIVFVSNWTKNKFIERVGIDPEGRLPVEIIPNPVNPVFIERSYNWSSEKARAAKELYATFVTGSIITTDATTAEMVKLMENSFRDVNIALANELAIVCEQLGIDVQEAIRLANRHPRVNILAPGPGVGGHCIPVDPYFIIERVPDHTVLLQTARMVNQRMPHHIADLVDRMADCFGVSRVTILGAAYKADVADFRESPALEVYDELQRRGYEVTLHDPFREDLCRPIWEVCTGSDLLLVATDHSEYKRLSPELVASWMSKKVLLDTRLTMPYQEWKRAGFVVWRLGDGRNRIC